MKVFLRSDIPDLGHKGEIKEVKRGYFRNFLYPRGLAIPVTLQIEERAKILVEKRKQEETKKLEQCQKDLNVLSQLKIKFMVKVAKSGKLYDAIDITDIIKKIKELKKIELIKKQILLDKPIKKVGKYKAVVALTSDLKTDIEIEVGS